jgi:hypothetical protein
MAGWIAAATIGSAVIGSNAASKAAASSAAASDRAGDVQRDMFERNVELNAPFREAGVNALNKLVPLTDYQNFGMGQFQADPGYAFRMSEGVKGLERSAAARGGLLSGATLKGIQRFGQDLASQEYQNAFNRYQTERNARLNPLQSLAGVGQTTSQQLGAAGTQFANTMGNIGMTNAMNQGNAGMARASIYGNTVNQLSQLYGGRNYGRSVGGGGGFQGGGQINPVSGEYMGSLEF